VIAALRIRPVATLEREGDFPSTASIQPADIVRVLRELPEPKAGEIIKLWLAGLDLPPDTVKTLREEARKQAR
jgi:hypothetical protein